MSARFPFLLTPIVVFEDSAFLFECFVVVDEVWRACDRVASHRKKSGVASAISRESCTCLFVGRGGLLFFARALSWPLPIPV